ncbi:MAG: hypothetical protein KZQ64_11275 [gamma proteobacterium symbiont of Bathyaustriella thionipta]|nr:hypothetical protein [gamma proteobacterium symbiont of Bathyaustriella thionipta]MCU7950607.1 hypothetical protein [gamma proteobacterium symbiont of Bathyaustriella thionipta]MCU7953953.1 hypothetical protein [gamma proteobacterium symbiont of Bathyaustriella thionipta]MCU7957115.1 hypothetical protein [gamma proteobacterium symbiont of Bathyaustriella thionipta]MCU7965943.1 hypothetical protein [gamma proteobacterium symbiont of Bathyaustriella thionipta]
MQRQLQLLTLFIFFISGNVLADIAVLVHGYHSSGNVWRAKGIVQLLGNNSWNDAGTYAPQGNYRQFGNPLSNTGKHVVTVELPSEAPAEIQANLLTQYLNDIMHRYPQQKIHLVAHSAGGIVTRLALVNNYKQTEQFNMSQLITIATPHLGSPIAEMANKASDTPISIVAPLFGADEINRSEILYKQLSREEKNYFLYWLNRQALPTMKYTSIIRGNGSLLKGDWLVPPNSQNMALVPVIGRNAQVIYTPGDHHLKRADGFILLSLLP